jgi:hypothetical protein
VIPSGTNLWALYLNKQPKDTSLSGAARVTIVVSRAFMRQLVKGFYPIKHRLSTPIQLLQGAVKVFDLYQRSRRKAFRALSCLTASPLDKQPRCLASTSIKGWLERHVRLSVQVAFKALRKRPDQALPLVGLSEANDLVESPINSLRALQATFRYLNIVACTAQQRLLGTAWRRFNSLQTRQSHLSPLSSEQSASNASVISLVSRCQGVLLVSLRAAFSSVKDATQSASNFAFLRRVRLLALQRAMKALLKTAFNTPLSLLTEPLQVRPVNKPEMHRASRYSAEGLYLVSLFKKLSRGKLRDSLSTLARSAVETSATSLDTVPQSAVVQACSLLAQVVRRKLHCSLSLLNTPPPWAAVFLCSKLDMSRFQRKLKAWTRLAEKKTRPDFSQTCSPDKTSLNASFRGFSRERVLGGTLSRLHLRVMQKSFDKLTLSEDAIRSVNQSQMQGALRTYHQAQLKLKVVNAFISTCSLKVEQHSLWRWGLAISQIKRRTEAIELALLKLSRATRGLVLVKAFHVWATTRLRLPKTRHVSSCSGTFLGNASLLYQSWLFRVKLGEKLIENSRCSIEQMALWKWSLKTRQAKLASLKATLLQLRRVCRKARHRVALQQWRKGVGASPRQLCGVLRQANMRWFYSLKATWTRLSAKGLTK